MTWCAIDDSLKRTTIEGFEFPLGVYPVEPLTPRAGYAVEFEQADGDDDAGDWEEWPDRYVYDVVMPANKVPAFWSQVCSLLPGRAYPILDFIGHDAYREIDPYIAYERVGIERLYDGVRRFAPFLFEDGMVGFGAVSDDPFFYVFLDEHKVFTIRVTPELQGSVEKLLEAFEVPPAEEPAAADSAAHEHRGVLWTPDDRPDLLSAEEIVERLREDWRLVLNVDPDGNLDDEGNELGVTPWRCLVRCLHDKDPRGRYAEVLLSAASLAEAEGRSHDALSRLMEQEPHEWVDCAVVAADRLTNERYREVLQGKRAPKRSGAVVRWLGGANGGEGD